MSQARKNIAAEMLVGQILDGGWRVERRLERSAKIHSGAQFSVGYEVIHPDGRRAFLKAVNYQEMLRRGPEYIEAAAAAYLHEKWMLEAVASRGGRPRVVRMLDGGRVQVPEAEGADYVDYMILELGESDVREYVSVNDNVQASWALECLSDVALGLVRIHGVGCNHGDMKPSNVVVFLEQEMSKIGDLGHSHGEATPNPWIASGIVKTLGDPRYAPPEIVYGVLPETIGENCRVIDLYHLGSLIMFLVADGVSARAVLEDHLDDQWKADNWSGSFDAVLPHLEAAFADVCEEFKRHVTVCFGPQVGQRLARIFKELCQPDPRYRGHPKDRISVGSSYNTERYANEFRVMSALVRAQERAREG